MPFQPLTGLPLSWPLMTSTASAQVAPPSTVTILTATCPGFSPSTTILMLLLPQLVPAAEAAVGATTAAVPAREAAQARIAAPRPRWSLFFINFLSRRAQAGRTLGSVARLGIIPAA